MMELVSENISIKEAQFRIREAEAYRTIVDADLFPDITLGGTQSRSNSQIGVKRPIGSLRGGLNGSWNLDIFGKTRAESDAALAREDIARASRDELLLALSSELAAEVIQWRTAFAKREVLRNQRETLMTLASLYRNQAQSGYADTLLAEETEAQIKTTEKVDAALFTTITNLQWGIAKLIGKGPHVFEERFASASHDGFTVPSPEIALTVELPQIRDRPDLRASRAALTRAKAELSQAEAALWPTVSIEGFFGAQHVSQRGISADNPIWSLASSFTAPLLNFGKLRGAVSLADASSQEAELSYEDAVLTALLDTNTAVNSFTGAYTEFKRGEEELDHRRTSATLSKIRYEKGLTDMTKPLAAQSSALVSESDVLDKRSEAAIAFVKLQVALGKGLRYRPDTITGAMLDRS